MKPIRTMLLLLLIVPLTACVQIGEIVQETPSAAPATATPRIIQATPTQPPPPTATQELAAAPILTLQNLTQIVEIAMFSPQSGWAFAGDGILYHTTDSGQTWQIVEIPFAEPQPYINITYYDENSLYIVPNDFETAPSQLYITRDSGQTWSETSLNNLQPGFVHVIILNPEILFLFEDLGAGAGSQGIRISRSLDGGQTWQETFAHIPGQTASASLPFSGQKSLPAFLTPELGFIGGSRPIDNEIFFFRTQDAGVTWQSQPLPVPSNIDGYMALVQTSRTFQDDQQNIIVPVNFSLPESDPLLIFFTSSDSGQTWKTSVPLAYGGPFHFIDPLTGWVWADGELYHTENGGQTWQIITTNLPESGDINQLNFTSRLTGWALVFELDFQNHLYATSDGGRTWAVPSP
jgi:photosystem II stability/assembly factor-like uncharacterized protein